MKNYGKLSKMVCFFSMLQQVMNHSETDHRVTAPPSNSNWLKSLIPFHQNTTERPQLTWEPLRTCGSPQRDCSLLDLCPKRVINAHLWQTLGISLQQRQREKGGGEGHNHVWSTWPQPIKTLHTLTSALTSGCLKNKNLTKSSRSDAASRVDVNGQRRIRRAGCTLFCRNCRLRDKMCWPQQIPVWLSPPEPVCPAEPQDEGASATILIAPLRARHCRSGGVSKLAVSLSARFHTVGPEQNCRA